MSVSLRRRSLNIAVGVFLLGLGGLTAAGGSSPARVAHVTSFRPPAPTLSVVQSGPEQVTTPPATAQPIATPFPTPTPTPAPKPKPVVRATTPRPAGSAYSGAQIVAIITAAAEADGVSASWLLSTAACESGYNPNAYNPAGPYEGLFQFLPSTFRAHGGTDIWDPTQQATIAATMFAAGESGEWPVCSRR